MIDREPLDPREVRTLTPEQFMRSLRHELTWDRDDEGYVAKADGKEAGGTTLREAVDKLEA